MTPIILKEESKERVIAFNNSAAPLGQRNDLDKFLRIAHEANRQDYLDLFEQAPSYDEVMLAAGEHIEGLILPTLELLPGLPAEEPLMSPEELTQERADADAMAAEQRALDAAADIANAAVPEERAPAPVVATAPAAKSKK